MEKGAKFCLELVNDPGAFLDKLNFSKKETIVYCSVGHPWFTKSGSVRNRDEGYSF